MSLLTDFIGNTDAFPILAKWNFFNHAGVSPLPRASADAMHLRHIQAEHICDARFESLDLVG